MNTLKKEVLDERSRLFRENREKAIPLSQVMENIKEKYQIHEASPPKFGKEE